MKALPSFKTRMPGQFFDTQNSHFSPKFAKSWQLNKKMPYPTLEEVYAMFRGLEDPPDGSKTLFDRFSPSVQFTAVGPPTSPRAVTYSSKAEFLEGAFGKLGKAARPPGLRCKIVDGIDGITVDETRGRAAVMMDTVDTFTHSGVKYEQHYAWHVRFDTSGMITEVRAYLDHGHLEEVLGAELKKMGIE